MQDSDAREILDAAGIHSWQGPVLETRIQTACVFKILLVESEDAVHRKGQMNWCNTLPAESGELLLASKNTKIYKHSFIDNLFCYSEHF